MYANGGVVMSSSWQDRQKGQCNGTKNMRISHNVFLMQFFQFEGVSSNKIFALNPNNLSLL